MNILPLLSGLLRTSIVGHRWQDKSKTSTTTIVILRLSSGGSTVVDAQKTDGIDISEGMFY